MTSTPALRNPVRLFTLAAATLLAIEIAIVRSRLYAAHADLAAWGVTADLTITIPLLWYLLVVRRGAGRPLTLAPVFVVCTTVAAALIPRAEQTFLHQLRFLAAPLEVVTLALVVRRIAAMRAGGEMPHDAEARIERAVAALFGHGVLAHLVASEVAILYYAFAGWSRQPVVPPSSKAVTVHERAGWGTIVACIVVMIAAESLGLHLLLLSWSRKAAWIGTALDLYGVLWLLGDYHALRLRPTLLSARTLEVRHGLRWNVTIDRDAIAAVERIEAGTARKRRATLRLALLEEPRYLIRLREPVVARGVAGLRRAIDSVAVLPDDPALFEREFGLALSSGR